MVRVESAMKTIYNLLAAFICSYLARNVSADYHTQMIGAEQQLFANYSKLHRPVKDVSTPTLVSVWLYVNHISRVNENQETLSLNGLLFSTWFDESLNRSALYDAVNSHGGLPVQPSRLWTPSYLFSNLAQGTDKMSFIHRDAALFPYDSTGKGRVIVWMRTDVSLKVTCNFEFSRYPYDVQRCPVIIRIATYKSDEVRFEVYDTPGLGTTRGFLFLNFDQVGLSDPWGKQPTEATKTVVAGWHITNISSRLVFKGFYKNYKAKTTFEDKLPADARVGDFDSFMEFWIEMRRYRSYFGITHILPALVTSSLTCVSLIVKPFSTAALLSTSNILLQSLFSIELLKSIPPSTGGLPGIVRFHGVNLLITFSAFLLISLINRVEQSGKKEFDSLFMKMIANFIVVTSKVISGLAEALLVTVRLLPPKDASAAANDSSSEQSSTAADGSGSPGPDLIPKAPPRQRAKVYDKTDQVTEFCYFVRGLCFCSTTLTFIICDAVLLT